MSCHPSLTALPQASTIPRRAGLASIGFPSCFESESAPVARRTKIAALGACIALAGAGAAAMYARVALRQMQPFYATALKVQPRELKTASREMESRVAALYSDANPPGRWQAAFTDDEVNGWLAVALTEKFPELLPPEVADPRVAFVDGGVLIGFHWRGDHLHAVVTVEAEAAMAGEDLVTLRLKRARAGSLPLPLADVVEQISLGAEELQWPLRWTHEDGSPVAVLKTADAFSTDDQRRQLEIIEVREGELLLAGSTAPAKDANRAAPKEVFSAAEAFKEFVEGRAANFLVRQLPKREPVARADTVWRGDAGE
jgi:hypothetical protein